MKSSRRSIEQQEACDRFRAAVQQPPSDADDDCRECPARYACETRPLPADPAEDDLRN